MRKCQLLTIDSACNNRSNGDFTLTSAFTERAINSYTHTYFITQFTAYFVHNISQYLGSIICCFCPLCVGPGVCCVPE